MDDSIEELIQFLDPDSVRLDIVSMTLRNLLEVSVTNDGAHILMRNSNLLKRLVFLLRKSSVAKDVGLVFINLSANSECALILLKIQEINIVSQLYNFILEDQILADPACMILCNLSSRSDCCNLLWNALIKCSNQPSVLELMVDRLSLIRSFPTYHYLAPLLSNLSQLHQVRLAFVNEEKLLKRLTPFSDFASSKVRRGGVVGIIRNCCFEVDRHPWLLENPDIDLLSRLLLPLTGSACLTEDEDEMERLPIDLQYLSDTKVAEEDADIRKMLLEALIQLCATKFGREYLRDKNAYLVLRQVHASELNLDVKLVAENIVDILIKNEHEIKIDNYKNVSVPSEIIPKLISMDQEYLKAD